MSLYDTLARWRWIALVVAVMVALTLATYMPGFGGGFVFDDYPNIVDNPAVQPSSASIAKLTAAALSSPSSDLKRPLSSLTFAANYLVGGLDAGAMRFTNVLIHLANGLLLFALMRRLLAITASSTDERSRTLVAGAAATAWLLLPINATAVLYVVQRMESLANVFVLIGLLGYVGARTRGDGGARTTVRCLSWIAIPTVTGVLAKETAILLPLYAVCVELVVFRFRRRDGGIARGIAWMHGLLLVPPLVAGALWLGPGLFDPRTWATRDFTLATRLLSEPRVLVDYLWWTVAPTASSLSFYHDDFQQSTGLLQPVTTLGSMVLLVALAVAAWRARGRRPLFALGIAFFFACHTLTGTVLPLELIYEHRNYFASIGVVMAAVDLCMAMHRSVTNLPVAAKRAVILIPALLIGWDLYVTTATAMAWGNSLSLAEELARRGPRSPRAQYELGRAYIIASRYVRDSPYTRLAYGPLELAATLPGSSILPEQALIFMNAKMRLPIKDAWWSSMVSRLKERPATVQDESSLDALATCLRDSSCAFPVARLDEAFKAALSHERNSARLFAMYASFSWASLRDHLTAVRYQRAAVDASPREAAYRIGLARYAVHMGDIDELTRQIDALGPLDIGGRLEPDLASLRAARADLIARGCTSANEACAR